MLKGWAFYFHIFEIKSHSTEFFIIPCNQNSRVIVVAEQLKFYSKKNKLTKVMA